MVDEVDLMGDDLKNLTGPALYAMMQGKIKESEMTDDLQQIDKLWATASKMRLWMMEKKKNVINKIEETEKDKFIAKIAKAAKEDKKEDKKDEEAEGTKDEENAE